MNVHAHGNEPTGEVFIDYPLGKHSRVFQSGRGVGRARFTIEEAQTLQRQLGVAIGEAAGQQSLDGLDRKYVP